MINRFAKGAFAVAATVALFGCAGAPAAAPPAPDRQVLSLGVELGLDAALAALPERIPVSEAKGVLVQIDPDKVVSEAPGYSVQNKDDDRRKRRIVTRGFSPYFGSSLSALSYYPYSNYYFPYYQYGSYYYPYSSARAALYGNPLIQGGPFYNLYGGAVSYYPFLYGGLGGTYSPYYWRWR